MPAKKGTPSPNHKPSAESRAEVCALTTFGVPQAEIAAYLNIDPKTMRKHYRSELDTSVLSVHAQVGAFLANAATGKALLSEDSSATFRDCLTAAIFYGKTRMGLKEAEKESTVQDVVKAIEIIRATKPCS